jgi:O-antigen/teichoic acid export membrane protein
VYRQIIGYIPSVVIPALISVLMIYAYTRLLTPAAFGTYTYVFSAILVLQTSLFFALPTAVMRFYPRAAVASRQDGFLKEAYVIFYALSAAIIVIGVCAGLIADLPDAYRHAAWLALPLLLFRSAAQLN